MPRQRKRPPHQRTQNRLPQRQRQNIPLRRKQPRHRRSSHKRQRHQHRIRPMQRPKQNAGHDRRRHRFLKRCQQPVRQKRIQPHLLQQTKCQVTPKPLRLDQMSRQPVQHPQKQARKTNQQGTNPKKPRRPLRRFPQIIRAPTQGFRRVPSRQKTERQPHQHHPPGPWRRNLKFPDECCNESCERQCLHQARPAVQAPLHADCPIAFRFSSGYSSVNSNRCSKSLSMSSVSPFLPK